MGHIPLDVALEDEVGQDALDLVHVRGLARHELQRLAEVFQVQLVVLPDEVPVTRQSREWRRHHESINSSSNSTRQARGRRTLS